MTHEELRKRVNEAAWAAVHAVSVWEYRTPTAEEVCNIACRAAIATIAEALKEPTQGMMEAISALDQWCSIHNMGAPPTAEATWEAMHAASPLYPAVKE